MCVCVCVCVCTKTITSIRSFLVPPPGGYFCPISIYLLHGRTRLHCSLGGRATGRGRATGGSVDSNGFSGSSRPHAGTGAVQGTTSLTVNLPETLQSLILPGTLQTLACNVSSRVTVAVSGITSLKAVSYTHLTLPTMAVV